MTSQRAMNRGGLTPRRYRRWTTFTLWSLTIIVVSGGAVRLTAIGPRLLRLAQLSAGPTGRRFRVSRADRVREPHLHRGGHPCRGDGGARFTSPRAASSRSGLAVVGARRRRRGPDRSGRPAGEDRTRPALQHGPLSVEHGAAGQRRGPAASGGRARPTRRGRERNPDVALSARAYEHGPEESQDPHHRGLRHRRCAAGHRHRGHRLRTPLRQHVARCGVEAAVAGEGRDPNPHPDGDGRVGSGGNRLVDGTEPRVGRVRAPGRVGRRPTAGPERSRIPAVFHRSAGSPRRNPHHAGLADLDRDRATSVGAPPGAGKGPDDSSGRTSRSERQP